MTYPLLISAVGLGLGFYWFFQGWGILPTSQVQVAKSPGLVMGSAWEDDRPSSAGLPVSSSELRRYVARAASGTRTALYQGADLTAPGLVGSEQKKSPRTYRGAAALGLALLSVRVPIPLGGTSNASPGDYRLTEQCIVPGSWYAILGTCAENPRVLKVRPY